MNDSDLSRFRQLIEARIVELNTENTLGKDSQKTVQLDQQSVGRLSRMDALQNQAMARATQARRDLELVRLAAALARMDEGEYGYCADCGDDIAPARLEFDPAVTRCFSCVTG